MEDITDVDYRHAKREFKCFDDKNINRQTEKSYGSI